MSLDAKGAAALALHRFGLGPRAGSIRMIASDPRGALLEEIERPGAGQIVNAGLLTSAAGARLNFAYNQQQQAKRIAARISAEQQKTTMAVMTPEDAKPEDTPMMTVPGAPERQEATPPQRNVNREVEARIAAAMAPGIGFVERLVWFWSNHFCVSAMSSSTWPVDMSARRFVRMCSASSLTCCLPSKAIRRCSSTSIISALSVRCQSPGCSTRLD